MSDRTIELSRRRVLGGIATLGGASAAAGAGTMAYFSDAGTSENEVIAGTLTLDFGGSGTFTFTSSLAPTETTSDQVTLVNGGTISGSLDVDVAVTQSDAGTNPTPDMSETEVAQNLEITRLEYGGVDVRPQISTSNSPPTLQDLRTNEHGDSSGTPNDLVDLPDPGAGTVFDVEFRLKNVSDDYQGDGVAVDFTFHLNQNDAM
jgi:predicted ribosomally synthesized peptide with SipW-like signal peptide